MPRRSGYPGWMRWSPEDGEGGLRRVLLPRPLVRRKATIKSTSAMRYSALEKTKTNDISQTQFPYNKARNPSQTQFDKPTASYSTNPQTASQTSLYRKYAAAARDGTGCCRILVPAARKYSRLQVDTKAVGQGPTYMSRFSAYLAFASINSRRGSTRSPMRTEKISSQTMASSISTLSKVRFSGSIVVSHS